MKPLEALRFLDGLLANGVFTREQHFQVQQAVELLKDVIAPKKEEKKKD